MKTPEEKIVIDYVVSGRFKKDLEQDKKHINRTIAETIASESTGKHLADKIEYYLNTIDELERKGERNDYNTSRYDDKQSKTNS